MVSYTKYLQFHMIQLPVWYEVHHMAQTRTSELYLLDELAGNTSLEILPSMTQALTVMDVNNSYMSKERVLDHTVGIAPGHSVAFEVNKDYLFSIMCNASVTASHRIFEYNKGENSIDETRTFWLPQASIYIMFHNITRKNWNYHIDAMVNSTAPAMINLVDLPVTDHLNRVLGNTNLTPSNMYTFKFRADRSDSKKRKHLFFVEYNNTHNALARGYYYDILTGQKTYRTYNVDGNMRANFSYEFFFPFGKNRQFNFTTTTRGIYNRSVDLIGTYAENIDFSVVAPKNIVNSFAASEKLSLNWHVGKHRLTAFADARLNRYTSSDIGFVDFTSWTCNYGTSAIFNLPKNWGISTDLTLYTRRGFLDSRLNNTEFVWNARVSKSIFKGAVTIVLDAYDILQQLNNITYAINAQARTETVSNVIPSYLLFHVYYRFNAKPKRK
ncbi:MAG: outer membrane beta-barrel family protein [Muribaculaceae bacterium]|nr:outer membrane beta-barrel family protein [Muribaculaceae bacterium]